MNAKSMFRVLATAIIVVASTTAAQANQPNSDLQKQYYEARKLAADLLKDKRVAVRVYKDFKANPTAYEIFHLATTDLKVSCDEVATAARGLSENSVLLVLPADQPDSIVRQVLEGYINCQTYRPRATIPLWPSDLSGLDNKWWTFLDALGNPIPNAQVEIELPVDTRNDSRIAIARQTTDASGRLARLTLIGLDQRFVLTLSHADYGIARVVSARPIRQESPSYTHTLPLVRSDSEAAASAVRGAVLDPDGNPVPGVEVRFMMMGASKDWQIVPVVRSGGYAVTDSAGRFTLYVPSGQTDDTTRTGPPFELGLEPPQHSNLRPNPMLTANYGANLTISLTRINTQTAFHTFAFEYLDGPVTDVAELGKITLSLPSRDMQNKPIPYDTFRNGLDLPMGMLIASTTRWGDRYNFAPIQLTADSPRDLVFKPQPPIVYTGAVVYEHSGQPAAGVCVLAGQHYALPDHQYIPTDPNSLVTPEQWDILRAQAEQDKLNPSQEFFHRAANRVAITDPNGRFEFRFLPGLAQQFPPTQFCALAPGYVGNRSFASTPSYPGAGGVVEIRLPLVLSAPQLVYRPKFVFEDESGPVTDPNLLNSISVRVHKADGSGMAGFSYSTLFRDSPFEAGIYSATALWNGKEYAFAPVDLTTDQPPVVVFKPSKIKKDLVTFRGQVIHAVTGAPMPGVIVFKAGTGSRIGLRPGMLEPQQWDAIRQIGPSFDPNHPALVPLKGFCGAATLTRTDAAGRFQLAFLPAELASGPFVSIGAIEKDFALSEQRLGRPTPMSERLPGEPSWQSPEPDQTGFVNLPPLRLFPAGRVRLQVIIPDSGSLMPDMYKIRLRWAPRQGEAAQNNPQGIASLQQYLNAGVAEVLLVPAGTGLSAVVDYDVGSGLPTGSAPIAIGPFDLKEGQLLDLGKLEFPRAIPVAVKVVDPAGRPVPNVTPRYFLADGSLGVIRRQPRTAADGTATLSLPPNSTGRIAVYYPDPITHKLVEESIPYQTAGPEDKDKVFTLQLSEGFIKGLRP